MSNAKNSHDTHEIGGNEPRKLTRIYFANGMIGTGNKQEITELLANEERIYSI